MKTKINSDFIKQWCPKYPGLGIGSSYLEYDNIIKIVAEEVNPGDISEETFIQIINWKTPRVKGIIRSHPFDYYDEGIKRAIKSPENEKIKILDDLHGIGVPIASTILHFIYPDTFPIMDIRVTLALVEFGYLAVKARSPENYEKFRSIMVELVKESNCSMRELDKALFAYHKIMLDNKSNYKKSCPR